MVLQALEAPGGGAIGAGSAASGAAGGGAIWRRCGSRRWRRGGCRERRRRWWSSGDRRARNGDGDRLGRHGGGRLRRQSERFRRRKGFRRNRRRRWRFRGEGMNRRGGRRRGLCGNRGDTRGRTDAPPADGFAACADTFSTFSAEPAASDSAAPKTATAAAEMVSFFACDTSQGRSRRGGGSLRGASGVRRGPGIDLADRRHNHRLCGRGAGHLFRRRHPPGPVRWRLGRVLDSGSDLSGRRECRPARKGHLGVDRFDHGYRQRVGDRLGDLVEINDVSRRGAGFPAASRPCGKSSSTTQRGLQWSRGYR